MSFVRLVSDRVLRSILREERCFDYSQKFFCAACFLGPRKSSLCVFEEGRGRSLFFSIKTEIY
jgi:hypothetical protein